MSTVHQSAISYLTTGELFNIIKDDSNWKLFEGYFQPKNILDAKFEEIKQIRHRVAHFRTPHEEDVNRVRLFLSEIDEGVWRFCSTMHGSGSGSSLPAGVVDPVAEYFVDTHEMRRVVEMHDKKKGFLYAQNSTEPRLGFHIDFSVRPWVDSKAPSLSGTSGVLYHANFTAIWGSPFSHEQVLKSTESFHDNCLYVNLSDSRGLQVIIPSVIDEDLVKKTIEKFLKACIENPSSVEREDDWLERLADDWPEYVLPPYHPIGLLSNETPSRMFIDID